jgi:hypothetical protein
MVFMPRAVTSCFLKTTFENAIHDQNLEILGWRRSMTSNLGRIAGERTYCKASKSL